MKTMIVGLLLTAAIPAQTPSPQTSTASPAAEIRTLETQAAALYTFIRAFVERLAERMPEEHYGFQPTPEVRTFGAAIGHLAQSNINQCSNLLQRKHALSGQDLAKTLTTKAELLKALQDSLAFCDEYVNTLKTGTLTETHFATTAMREGQRVPVKVPHGSLLTSLIGHNNEMYGYLSMYLRLKGIVPPSSEPRR